MRRSVCCNVSNVDSVPAHPCFPGEFPDDVAVRVVALRAVRLVHDEQTEVARREEPAAQVVRDHLRAGGTIHKS